LLGYAFDGSPVGDLDLKQEFLPALTDVVRRDEHAIAQFTPFLVNVTDADIERLETERERTVTKKKRATRGRRGVVLPDREPIRTVRMRIGGEVDDFGRPLARLHGPREPFIVRPAPPRRPPTNSRRAAALAARANITEMSNTDQDDRFETLPPPSPASRLKRSRVGTATPAPNREETPSGPVRPSSKLSERLIPKEERISVPLDVQPKAEEATASRPGSSGKSEWKCASCGRPESGLKGMHKAKGPNGPDTVCSSCGKSMIAEKGRRLILRLSRATRWTAPIQQRRRN
jgi:SWI/SNF-related matrix-associated actin-dependent regulator of chromatin subfamily B protein 1